MIPFVPDFTLGYDFKFCYSGTISSDTDTDGTAIDAQTYEGPVHLVALVGNSGDAQTVVAIKLIECATSGGSYTAVTGASKTLSASATANDNSAHFVRADNYQQRYLKSRVTTSGGGTPSVPIHIGLLAKKKIGGGSGVLTTG